LLIDGLDSPPIGEAHQIRARVENFGPDAVEDAVVQFDLELEPSIAGQGSIVAIAEPEGSNCTLNDLTIVCNNLDLPAYKTAELAIDIAIMAAGLVTATATVSSTLDDPAAADNLAVAEYVVGFGFILFRDQFL
jgi:hypothetical protein